MYSFGYTELSYNIYYRTYYHNFVYVQAGLFEFLFCIMAKKSFSAREAVVNTNDSWHL